MSEEAAPEPIARVVALQEIAPATILLWRRDHVRCDRSVPMVVAAHQAASLARQSRFGDRDVVMVRGLVSTTVLATVVIGALLARGINGAMRGRPDRQSNSS